MEFRRWRDDELWKKLEITTAKVKDLPDPEFIWKNVIVWGHFQQWVAESGAGKTTVAFAAAKACAANGMTVLYAHFDVSGSDLKGFCAEANEYEHLHLIGDLDASPNDFDRFLRRLTDEPRGFDFGNTLIFFDTLNKFTDPMHKRDLTRWCKETARRLANKGCTIVSLHHATKRREESGKLIFDGVREVITECDELWYMNHVQDPLKNTHTVDMTIEKCRGSRKFFKTHTFQWDNDVRVVESVDFIDLAAEEIWLEITAKEPHIVGPMRERLANEPMNQSEAIDYLNFNHNIGKNKARNFLQHGAGREWKMKRGDNNSWIYYVDPP